MQRFFLLAIACAVGLVAPAVASAASVRADYSVSVRGLPVGSARLKAEFADGRYAVKFSGRVKGLVRLFSDARASAEAEGEESDGHLLPAVYQHQWTEDDDAEIVNIRFADLGVSEVSVEPPPKHPERYVPVTAAHKAGVLDPVSAFVWPAPGGATPDICDRTLPLFDGQQRFDLALSFSRSETFSTGDGSYSGPAVVCAIRYRPISGHRPGKESVQFMAENKDMEVWMAPTSNGDVVVPVKISIRTSFGRVVLEARDFSAD